MVTIPLPTEAPVLEWRAPGAAHHKRGKAWYSIAATIIGCCLLFSIWTQAWSFTIVTVLITTLYWYTHRDPPKERQIRIWADGYAVNKQYTPWNDCTGYWMLRGPGYNELHIEKKRGPNTVIQTGAVNPVAIHQVMQPLLPEQSDRRESTLDTIIRICKL